MQQTDQSKSPVKYELLTPLGDEDIADRREIAEINTFRNRIVTDPGIDSDPGSHTYMYQFAESVILGLCLQWATMNE